MPYLYIMAGAELADALRSEGRTKDAAEVVNTTVQVAHAIQLDGVVRGLREQAASPSPTGDSLGIPLTGAQPKTQSTGPTVKTEIIKRMRRANDRH